MLEQAQKLPKGPTKAEGEQIRREVIKYLAWWAANRSGLPVIHVTRHQARALELAGVRGHICDAELRIIEESR